MDNKKFDQNKKQKLSELETNTPPPDWDDFSKILSSEEEFSDLGFDQAISEALKNKRKSYNSLHWIKLKNRLQTEARLRKEVYTTKIFEFILILLLSFTFINLDKHYNLTKDRNSDPIAEAMHEVLKYPQFSGLMDIDQLNTEILNNKFGGTNLEEKYKKVDAEREAFDTRKNSNRLSINFIPYNIIKLNNELHLYHKESIVESDEQEKSDVASREGEHSRSLAELEELKTIDTRLNKLKNAYPEFYYPMNEEQEHTYFVTSGVNSNFNTIRSPEDPIFGVDAYNVYDPSVSFGIGVGTLHGNYELSTGVTFERMQYQPKKITEFTLLDDGQINKSSLDRIEFDIVSLPVNFRYHVHPQKKTHFWMGIGIAMNMAIWSDYDIESSKVQRIPAVYDRSVVNLANRAGDTYLNKKNFHEGFLESGRFFDNFYLSSYAEIGLSKQINNQVRYNVSLGYSTSFTNNGIGPNFDTFDALRLGLGIAYNL
jgi:hypothetical protein